MISSMLSTRLGLCAIGMAGAIAATVAGCTGDDTTDAAPTDAGMDSTSADGPESADTSGNDTTSDTSKPRGDDGGVDAGPAFDCDADTPDAGAEGGAQAPTDLRCTGLYADWDTKTVAADMRPFTPGYVLWSDGAVKSRWVHLPSGQKIDATNPDEWVFPVGTKFFKEFAIGGARVETRLFWKVASGQWVRTTYKWSKDESTATRLDIGSGGPPADAGVIDDGGANLDGAATFEIPSVQKCDACHNGRTDKVLGFEAVSLGAAKAAGVTLTVLKNEGLLVTDDGGVSSIPATLTIPEDATGNARESIGWLHANCGTTCHNANPKAGCYFNTMRLRVKVDELAGTPTVQSLELYATTHDVPATVALGDPAFNPYDRIAHGVPSKSLVRYLIGRRTTEPFEQMPPLDTHIVDTADLATIDAWITQMP
jgi:hypothetical protein